MKVTVFPVLVTACLVPSSATPETMIAQQDVYYRTQQEEISICLLEAKGLISRDG